MTTQYKPAGVIVLTALVPTTGHQFLIDFAADFMKSVGGLLHVIICSRSHEPVKGAARLAAFREHYRKEIYCCKISFYLYENDDAPQNPSDHTNFWGVWKEIIETTVKKKFSYVFASEKYGENLAACLGATFVPCDISRNVVPVKGTNVRNDIFHNFMDILPEMKPSLRTKVTFFGAESTGKTTISKEIAHRLDYYYVPEWAREYLETVGPKITSEKMKIIGSAQYSIQNTVNTQLMEKQGIICDTDILSTIGYYRILNKPAPQALHKWFHNTVSDLYIVMNSKIPFVPDRLRYGIDKRESTDQFWIDLLKEFNCKFHIMESTDKMYQIGEAFEVIKSLNFSKFGAIKNFVRD